MFVWYWSLLIHWLSKADPCCLADWHSIPKFASPFNLSPASRNNPSPADLRWQVEAALGCPWPPLHGGLAWDWIRPDQTSRARSVLAGAGRARGITEALLGFLSYIAGLNESHQILFQVHLSVGNLKRTSWATFHPPKLNCRVTFCRYKFFFLFKISFSCEIRHKIYSFPGSKLRTHPGCDGL